MTFEEWAAPIVARLNTFRLQPVSTDKLINSGDLKLSSNKIRYKSKILDKLNEQTYFMADEDMDSEE